MGHAQISTFPGNGSNSGNVGGFPNQQDQKIDSSQIPKKVKKARLFPQIQLANTLWLKIDTLKSIDTTFGNVHRYTAISRQSIPIANLGTPGSPEKILSIQPFNSTGISLGLNNFKIQSRTPDNLVFCKVAQPYTKFRYSQGVGGLIALDAFHTQNLSPTWNVVLDYSSTLNEDMYQVSSQQNLNRSTVFGSNYHSMNGHYEQQVIFSWNRSRRIENGGLLSDSMFYGPNFQQSNTSHQRLFGYYFPNLTTSNSFWAQTDHRFKHRYYFDSTKTFGVAQSLRFQKVRYQYTDKNPDTSFYRNSENWKSKNIADSTAINLIEHRIGLNFQKKWSAFLANLQVNHIYQFANFQYDTNKFIYNKFATSSHGIEGILNSEYRGWQIFAESNLFLIGYAQKAFLINSSIKKKWRSNDEIGIAAHISNSPWSLAQSFQTSKYASFNADTLKQFPSVAQNFTQQQFLSAYFNYQSPKVQSKFSLTIGSLQNDFNLIGNLTPKKIASVNYIQLSGDFSFQIGKFIVQEQLYLQANHSGAISNYGLPNLTSRTGLYYQNDAFKKALFFRLGTELYYSSSYWQLNYRPDIASFYYGNTNSNPMGNYPIFDAFVSARIKTVDLFLKYEHLNEWYVIPGVNKRYESTYRYPIEPFRLRVGFTWIFWD